MTGLTSRQIIGVWLEIGMENKVSTVTARSSVYCVKLTVTEMFELAGLADCAKQMRAAAATRKTWSPVVA